ncbi:unnamed protein product, partial [Pylaiella littoralis]
RSVKYKIQKSCRTCVRAVLLYKRMRCRYAQQVRNTETQTNVNSTQQSVDYILLCHRHGISTPGLLLCRACGLCNSVCAVGIVEQQYTPRILYSRCGSSTAVCATSTIILALFRHLLPSWLVIAFYTSQSTSSDDAETRILLCLIDRAHFLRLRLTHTRSYGVGWVCLCIQEATK